MYRMNGHEADALLKGALRLDRIVLSQVFDVFFPEILAYIVFRIGDPQLSSEIARQVFTDFLNSLSMQGQPNQNLAGWLFKSAGELAQAHLQTIVFDVPSVNWGAGVPNSQDLEVETEQARPTFRLQSVLQKLSAEHQHFLALRFSSQYSLDDVGRILNKSSNTVKDLQYQALKAFQQALQIRTRQNEKR